MGPPPLTGNAQIEVTLISVGLPLTMSVFILIIPGNRGDNERHDLYGSSLENVVEITTTGNVIVAEAVDEHVIDYKVGLTRQFLKAGNEVLSPLTDVH